MKIFNWFAIFLGVGLPWTAGAAPIEPQAYAAGGQLILTQLVAAPFPHSSRATGHTYKGEFFPAEKHYSDSTVAFVIPKHFRAGATVDFVIHFHGWKNTVASTLEQYQLPEQLAASGRNAILLIPEGPHNAPDSAGGKLEEADGFKRFMTEAMAVLRENKVLPTKAALGNVILSGHSGGYHVISAIVAQGGLTDHVREVWLFDALYSQTPRFLAWAETTKGRLLNIYTDGGGTKVRTEAMIEMVREQKVPFWVGSDQLVSRAELQTNRFVFLHTDLKHNEVVAKRKTFQAFLETSCLTAAPSN